MVSLIIFSLDFKSFHAFWPPAYGCGDLDHALEVSCLGWLYHQRHRSLGHRPMSSCWKPLASICSAQRCRSVAWGSLGCSVRGEICNRSLKWFAVAALRCTGTRIRRLVAICNHSCRTRCHHGNHACRLDGLDSGILGWGSGMPGSDFGNLGTDFGTPGSPCF